MIALVTGAAGFIGSHLCHHLLSSGDEVRGVDAFTDYYPRGHKEQNVSSMRRRAGFTLVEGDLSVLPLAPLLDGVDVVYHLAGQPGVRTSWGSEFETYVRHNVLASQRLLEECRQWPLRKFVYTSSSSVYGDARTYPVTESAPTNPISPYGVTKLAGEHLCFVYRHERAVPTATLRLFSVYGPRQRPDMAFSRLVTHAVLGGTFEVYGDGKQTRDWTYVEDVAVALRSAAVSDWLGVANIGGGVRVSMNDVIATLSAICGPIELVHRTREAGDARHTGADTRVAADAFGYRPATTLDAGLRAMVEWERDRQAAA
ncbi:MAG: NAD-dependent epimerase/dehydratase family protein [Solirubrobacteraceae bacterium]